MNTPKAFYVLGIASLLVVLSQNVIAANVWDPNTPIPRFVTDDFVDLHEIREISKFRSGAGHEYVDSFESGSSMKHYFAPFVTGSKDTLEVFSPISGKIINISEEQHTLSTGEKRSYQIWITPTSDPAFAVILFHINYDPALQLGALVSASQALGFADLRESFGFDIAIAAKTGSNQFKYLSLFDVLDPQQQQEYAAFGLTLQNAIISKAYRDSNPVTWGGYNPGDWITLQQASAVPEPSTFWLLGAGLVSFGIFRKRIGKQRRAGRA